MTTASQHLLTSSKQADLNPLSLPGYSMHFKDTYTTRRFVHSTHRTEVTWTPSTQVQGGLISMLSVLKVAMQSVLPISIANSNLVVGDTQAPGGHDRAGRYDHIT